MTISGTYTPDAYTGNASTTEFPVTYPFFGTSTDAEIEVIERTIATGAEATLVNGTDYTVAGGSGSTGTVTATTAPAATVQWIIRRTTTETQETDYVENDPFPAESHEAALDRLTLVAQEATEASSRALQFPVSYTGGASNLFPEPIASTVIQWNAAANALEGGPTTTEIINAESNATAAAASADAAAASAASAATTYDNFDDRYLGSKASDPTLDNDGDALIDGALYFDTTLNVMKFYDLGNTAWKQTTPTSADQTNIDAAVANASNINAVAAIDTDVTTVAGISSDVTTVAADGTDIGTVAGISANITTVAGISSDVTTVAGISGDVSSVAAQVIGYDFSTTTAMADPGSGNVRFNNATVASVTAIAIDDLDKNGVDQSAYIALFDDSTNTVKGTLVFRTGGGDVATFNITGLTDNTGWFQIAVTHVASSGTFADGEDTFIGFTRAGDKGADGAGSGDVSGPGSATDNAVVRWDGTSGQLVQNSGVTINDSGDLTANNLSGTHSGTSSGTNTGDEVAASESTAGVVELATTAEAEAGTDTVRAVTPAGAAAAIAALATSVNPNLIINGDMRIAQRGTSFTGIAGANTYTLDRWQFKANGLVEGVYSVAQETSVVPAKFSNALKATCTTAEATAGASYRASLRYSIEGYDVSDLDWGSADAQQVTISFKVRSSLIGTYCVALSNGARTIRKEYTISVADTWEEKTLTFAGDTTGTWAVDNTQGVEVQFALGVGANLSAGTDDTWETNDDIATASQVDWGGTLNATFYLTGVKLEVGSTATAFVPDDYGTALAKCMRYYWRVTEDGTLQIANSFHFSTTQGLGILPLPVIMRSDASGTFSNAADFNVNALTSGIDVTALTLNSTPTAAKFTYTVASSLTAGHGSHIYFDGAGTRWFALDAEL